MLTAGLTGRPHPTTPPTVLLDLTLTVATSVALHFALPGDGALTSSLVALPWVWLLLRRVHAALPAPGPGPTSGGDAPHLLTPACLFLAAAAFLIDNSGLDSLARCWAPVAWLTVVALLTTWVPRAEILLQRDPSLRPSSAFLLAPLALYLLALPWSTSQRPPDGDEPWYLLVAHSLSHDFDADLADNYERGDSLRFVDRRIEPQPGDPVGPDGERYSRHLLTLPLLLALPYRIGGRIGALATMALLCAALCWATLALARARPPGSRARQLAPAAPRPLLLAWGLLSFTSPLLLYSHQVWVEVPAALLTVIGLIVLQSWTPPEDDGWSRSSVRPLAALAAVAVLLPIFKLRFTLLSFGLLLLALLKLRRQRRTVALISVAAVMAVAALMTYNQLVFGNALRIHNWEELAIHRMDARLLAARAAGLAFDVSFGLLAAAPIWLLAFAGVWLGLRTLLRRDRAPGSQLSGTAAVLWQLAVVVGPYLFLVVTRREWYGGWSPPFRYALVALPLLTLLVAHALDDLAAPGRRQTVRLLIAATLLLQTIWLAVPGWTYNFADGRTLLADRLETSLGFDLLRALPSASRLRAATWLVPLAVVVTFLVLWFWRRAAASRVLAPAAVLMLAATPQLLLATPTWRVEPEARWVRRDGGSMEPEQWMFDRTRLPEAWVFPDSAGFEATITPGGDWFELRVLGRLIRNRDADLDLTVSVDGKAVGTLSFSEPDQWVLAPSPRWRWPAGGRATLRLQTSPSRGEGPPDVVNGLAIDRVELDWFGSEE